MQNKWVNVSDELPSENCYVKFVVENDVYVGTFHYLKNTLGYLVSLEGDIYRLDEVSMYQLIDITMPEIKSK